MRGAQIKAPVEPLWWTLANAGWVSLLVGTIVGVAGLYAAWFFYKKAQPRPSLQLTSDSTLLVGPVQTPLADKLQILFDGAPVTQVTSTTIAVWNDGTTTFRKDDIAKADPVRFVLRSGKILQAETESVSRDVIGANISGVADNQINLSFDFFEPNDALVVRILHSSAPGDLFSAGTIVGLPQGIRPYQPFKRRQFLSRAADRAFFALFAVLIIGLTIAVGRNGGGLRWLAVPGSLAAFAGSVTAFIWIMEKITARWKKAVPSTVLANSQLRRRLELAALFNRVG